ncbi:MAG: LPS export ABC transporter permease LptG [Burkholderiaceae bacterium]|nr:LPS export ABC transporter permease LptG [Burkholderiaceae bacterium]
MRTLQRYLWREIAAATAFVAFALLALFSFFDLINEIEEVGAGGYQLAQAFGYVALSLPSRAYELAPIAALIGTIYALSKLAANSEFTIMRVSGMSTRRLAGCVVRVGLVLVALTYLLGEVVAPPAERIAQRAKLQATGATLAQQFRSGVWVRDAIRDAAGNVERLRFVNVRDVRPDGSTQGWRIFEFDREFRLLSVSTAQSGAYVPGEAGGNWRLTELVQTRVPELVAADTAPTSLRTQIVREPQRMWTSELTPEIFGVVLVKPERMAAYKLAQYVRHLAENQQDTGVYEIAFWNKVFYPLAILVMMALALPFAYLHVRAGSVSLKIFSGVMIGVGFYMLNKLFAHLGVLHTWPPIVIAALPSLVVLSVALAALYWIERR